MTSFAIQKLIKTQVKFSKLKVFVDRAKYPFYYTYSHKALDLAQEGQV